MKFKNQEVSPLALQNLAATKRPLWDFDSTIKIIALVRKITLVASRINAFPRTKGLTNDIRYRESLRKVFGSCIHTSAFFILEQSYTLITGLIWKSLQVAIKHAHNRPSFINYPINSTLVDGWDFLPSQDALSWESRVYLVLVCFLESISAIY